MEQRQRNPIDELLVEFLEAAVHSVLSIRGIYPAEIFERKRHFNVPVPWARHPQLKEYIHSSVSSLQPLIRQGLVEKVAVVVFNSERIPAERFVFKLCLNREFNKELPLSDLEYCLRAFLLRLGTSQHWLSPLPPDCSWELVTYAKTLLRGDQWIPADSGTWDQPPLITPIKSMTTEPLDVQLYLEQPRK